MRVKKVKEGRKVEAMKTYRLNEAQVQYLWAIYARLEDYRQPDRRMRTTASDMLKGLLDELDASHVDILPHPEKTKAADHSTAREKLVNSTPLSSA